MPFMFFSDSIEVCQGGIKHIFKNIMDATSMSVRALVEQLCEFRREGKLMRLI